MSGPEGRNPGREEQTRLLRAIARRCGQCAIYDHGLVTIELKGAGHGTIHGGPLHPSRARAARRGPRQATTREEWRSPSAREAAEGAAPAGTPLSRHEIRNLTGSQKPRVAAQVVVSLLEALRLLDRPGEMLEDEVIARTIPRRFGLSRVVERQIELYQEYARQGRKLSGDELAGFVNLVTKRPDASEVFLEMGALLADEYLPSRKRWMPRSTRLMLVRRAIERTLAKLFGQRVGGFVSGPFSLEVSASPFVQLDASGDACELITGFCRRAVRRGVDEGLTVVKLSCETDGARSCRWSVKEREGGRVSRTRGRA